MIKVLILLCMIFCHIVDDYYLQGWLASAKQREWWGKNAPNPLYKYDYLVALFMHSFSWAFVMMLPIMIIYYLSANNYILYLILFPINIMIHAITDHTKANLKKINLVQDQSIHIIQIILTWIICIII